MKIQILILNILLFLNSISSAQYVCVPEKVNNNSQTVMNLNGTWKFNPQPPDGFEKIKSGSAQWENIEVPGEWVLQGFNVEKGDMAAYARSFNMPSVWGNSVRIFLRCDAIFSKAIIWINGRKAGEHTGGMSAFELDITSMVNRNRDNKIAIGVISETRADTLMSGSQYAAHPLGGILRKIYLFAVPECYIGNLSYETDMDENYNNSQLIINGTFYNPSGKNSAKKIKFLLFDPEGKNIKLSADVHDITFKKGSLKVEKEFVFNINSPLKWDTEHPNLYRMLISFGNKESTETIGDRIGFREIHVVGNQLFLNGVPIKLRGVNRHETHPLLGRSLNNELWYKDAKLFKEVNVNYIRTSHYPPAEEFIEWCDSIGLFVELENPLCWIGHGANATWRKNNPDDPGLYSYLEQVAGENIAFFKNHPSIIIWSMANESAWNDNWTRLLQFYERTDPTRPVTFHDQAYGDYNNYGSDKMPIANIHYPGPSGPDVASDFKRPLLFGEYCHLNCYNRREAATDPGVRDAWGSGFKKMWENMYKSRGCLGGAIWSGIDDIFSLPDESAVGYGEWGPIDSWRRKKPEYYHIKKTYSPVRIHNTHVKVPGNDKPVKLQIENRFFFTNLDECKIEWKLGNETGNANINLEPGKSGLLNIYTNNSDIDGKVLLVNIFSPRGYLIDESAIDVGNMKRDNYLFHSPETGIITLDSTTNQYIIGGNKFSWKIDRESGEILSGNINNKDVLTGGADLMILPLVTGPCQTDYKLDIPVLNNTCTEWQMKDISASETNDTVFITFTGSYKEAEGQVKYLFTTDGGLIIEYEFISQTDINPRQWGLVLSANRNIQNLEWSRKGLWTVYPKDHIGRTHGIASPFNNSSFNLITFKKKPENKWYFDANELGSNDFRSTKENIYWASLTDEDNTGLVIKGDGENSFRAFVDGDKISFLVSGFSTGGGDLFFSKHYKEERKPLSKGDSFSGKVNILLVTE